jgi:predicted acetyltransferase
MMNMNNNIRQLTYEDLDQSFALSQFAFQYVRTPEEIAELKKRAKLEQMWGYFENGKLASKMTIFSFQTFINGKEFAMGGIASVATWPEYRRKGMVGKLLIEGLKKMKEQGQTISFLAPFSFSFYRRYGWEMHSEYKKYTLQVNQLPSFDAVHGRIQRVEQDIQLLNTIYEQYARKFNGMLKRTDEWWDRSVYSNKKVTTAIYYNKTGEPRGYLIYVVKNSEMKIDEFIHLDNEGYKGLWQFIKNHDSMIKKVSYNAPSDDQLMLLLQDPEIEHKVVPYFMVRIVDVASFLEQYPFQGLMAEESYSVQVIDQYAPWNEGIFQISVDQKGEVNVKHFPRSQDQNQEESPINGFTLNQGISCDIQTLSTMLLGYQRPSLLNQVGRLKGRAEDIEKWEAIIPKKTTYLMDYF